MSVNDAIVAATSIGVVAVNLLAQVAAPAVPGVESIPPINFNSLTATGILAWYAWYVTTRSQPKLIQDLQASLERMQQVQASEAAASREERARYLNGFLGALKDLRCQYEEGDKS